MIFPLSGSINRFRQRNKVVFPPPDGPTRVTISPLLISILISFNIRRFCNDFDKCSTVNMEILSHLDRI